MKVIRILSALLTLTLLLSCICIFSSAQSEAYTGVYKGYNYYASAYVNKTDLRVSMRYVDTTAKIRIESSYNYLDEYSRPQTGTFLVAGKASSTGSNFPQSFSEFVSLTPSYFINGNLVLKFTVSA